MKSYEELNQLTCRYDSDCYMQFLEDNGEDIDNLDWEYRFKLIKDLYTRAKDCTEIGYFLHDEVRDFFIPKFELENIKTNIKFDINGKITVYRGVNKYNLKNGCSYTLDKSKAEWFANRYGDGGYVIEKEITVDDIVFYDNSRKEQEVFLKY